jgi:hypothetical protein
MRNQGQLTAYFPFSLWFFVAAGVIVLMQFPPVIGVFLMMFAAPFWAGPLINLGMIGIAFEAIIGRVWRIWLVLPVLFYGGYWATVVTEQVALSELTASYDAANAKVRIQFDPDRNALVFEDELWEEKLIKYYDFPVEYRTSKNVPEGYQSTRIVDRTVCDQVWNSPGLMAAGIDVTGGLENHSLCLLSMPERPQFPITRISEESDLVKVGTLPVRRQRTLVTTPDGKQFDLLGGDASPLSWWPMFVAGCGLISAGAPSWTCAAQLTRTFTPIVSGEGKYSRDSDVLARSLGLKRIPIQDRRPSESLAVQQAISMIEKDRLSE